MKLVQLLYWHQLIVVVAPLLVTNCKSSIVAVLVDCHSIQRWNCIELLYRNQLIVVVEPTKSMHVDYHSCYKKQPLFAVFGAKEKSLGNSWKVLRVWVGLLNVCFMCIFNHKVSWNPFQRKIHRNHWTFEYRWTF
jgi:hypothetical protein